MRAREVFFFAVRGNRLVFATVAIDHKRRVFVMSFVSRSTRDWKPLRGAELNAQQSGGAVFTLAWDIYHLPLCDVGSKNH